MLLPVLWHGLVSVGDRLVSSPISWRSLQSCKQEIKFSNLGEWTHLLHFMASLGIDMSVLALIIWDSNSSFWISAHLGLGCSTRGKHHVIVSPPETFSNIMFSFTPCPSYSLRGFCRWYGTGHSFWATGIASGSISSLTSTSLPVLFSWKHPIPWNVSLYSLSNASMSSGGFTDLIL